MILKLVDKLDYTNMKLPIICCISGECHHRNISQPDYGSYPELG